METIELYYFSGTGNSIYAARKIRDKLPGSNMIPVVGSLRNECIKPNAKTVGLVFPLQGPTVPNAVKLFLSRLDPVNVDYMFAVATRGGTTCLIQSEIDRILKKSRRKLNAHFLLNMFNNDPKLKKKKNGKIYDFHTPTDAEILQNGKYLSEKVEIIADRVLRKEDSHEKDYDYYVKYGFLLKHLVLFAMRLAEKRSLKSYFYSDQKCNGCGICQKVCLSERISLVDSKPQWDNGKLCYMCYACLNFCPKQSVQINSKWYMKSYTTEQGRYLHSSVSISDMVDQRRIPATSAKADC